MVKTLLSFHAKFRIQAGRSYKRKAGGMPWRGMAWQGKTYISSFGYLRP